MSSRALRKAQRELEMAQQKLRDQQDAATPEDVSDDVDDHDHDRPEIKTSAFAMLADVDDEDDDDDDDVGNEADKQDAPQRHGIDESIATFSKTSMSASKKKKRKKKKKPTQSKDDKTEAVSGLDEIDQALQQLSTHDDISQSSSSFGASQKALEIDHSLLAIDANHLHAQNEMKRLFGRAALNQDDVDQPAPEQIGGNRRQQRRVQQVGLAQALRGHNAIDGRSNGLAALALRKNTFVQGKDSWPGATGGGLGMEVEEKCSDGTWLYRFVHNMAYQDVQSQFESCVESMDPNRLVLLLQHNPYHISTLLQVSEIAKHEGSHTTAGDLLERALFSFGRALHSTFAKKLAQGQARLDFARPENREFWLAGWRYMQNLSMRGTWRTVYEWAKLLLSLSPEDDPYALWLVLDQYALRARQDLDLLNLARSQIFRERLQSMPNIQLSQGLAEYRSGDKTKGQQTLFSAVGQYPWVVARLMQLLAVDTPPGIWGKDPRTERETLHSELYSVRAKDIWNTPEASALLIEIASALPPEAPSATLDGQAITRNEARHVMLSDEPTFIALIPRALSAATMSVSDPLPPDNNVTTYFPTSRSRPNASSGAGRSREEIGEHIREYLGLSEFLDGLFPFNMLHGTLQAENNGENGDETAEPSREMVERALQSAQEAGIDRDVILQRFHRVLELRQMIPAEYTTPGELEAFLTSLNDDDEEASDQEATENGSDEG